MTLNNEVLSDLGANECQMTKLMERFTFFVCAVVGMFVLSSLAQAQDVIVGVNAWYRPPDLSQEDMAKQLAENGVKTIRISLMPGSVEFITRAWRHGVTTLAIVGPHTGSTAKKKNQFWASLPLSEVKPQEFTAAVKPMLDQLEAAGVRLAGLELGNEINTSGYNGDIAAPGSGRLLELTDLGNPNDQEALPIAAGFRNYVKIAAALNLTSTRPLSRLELRISANGEKRPSTACLR